MTSKTKSWKKFLSLADNVETNKHMEHINSLVWETFESNFKINESSAINSGDWLIVTWHCSKSVFSLPSHTLSNSHLPTHWNIIGITRLLRPAGKFYSRILKEVEIHLSQFRIPSSCLNNPGKIPEFSSELCIDHNYPVHKNGPFLSSKYILMILQLDLEYDDFTDTFMWFYW